MYQQITIIGNLGRDPESKQSKNGKQYAQVSVAASRSLGQGQKETTWFAVTAWENQAQYLVNYAQKGSTVMVVGRIVPDAQTGGPRIWVDNSGNSRANFEIMASDVKILNGFKNAEDRTATPQPVSKQLYPRKTARDLDREDNPDFEY